MEVNLNLNKDFIFVYNCLSSEGVGERFLELKFPDSFIPRYLSLRKPDSFLYLEIGEILTSEELAELLDCSVENIEKLATKKLKPKGFKYPFPGWDKSLSVFWDERDKAYRWIVLN